jgi:hypothetical protein
MLKFIVDIAVRLHRVMPRLRATVAVTLGCLILGGLMFGNCSSRAERRVVVEARVLKYYENERLLEFQIDWFPNGRVVYVPSADRWRKEIASWARERRDEIIATMKELTRAYHFKWEEY